MNACCRNVDPWRHLVGSWRTFASSAGRNTDMSSPLPTHRHKSWLPPPLPLQLQQQLLLLILQYGPKSRTCLSVDNSVKVTRRKACDMSKVLECCRQNGPNLHNKSFNYSLPNLHKSLLPLKLGICLHSHFSVGALEQTAWSQNFSNWPAKKCANRMLGSADPEHIDSSDRSAA